MVNSVEPLIIHLICSSGFYGAERVVANRCSENTDYRQAIVCLTDNPQSIDAFKSNVANKVPFHIVENKIISGLKALKEIATSNKTIIVHSHGYKEIVIGWLFSKRTPCRHIVTQHGFTERNLKSKIYNLIDMSFCRWSSISSVICVSKAIEQRYRHFGLKSSKLTLLPNAVPLPSNNVCAKTTEALRHNLNIENSFPIILYAGRLSQEKDPILFVKVLEKLHQSGLKFNALIAGEGPLHEEVEFLINSNNLSECVKLLGFVDSLDYLLSVSSLLLITSKTEGTPMIALEAMAAKCITVSANVGGMPDIIKHNVNGFLIDSRDPEAFASQCNNILNDTTNIHSVQANALDTIKEKYSIKQQNTNYERLYLEAIV